MRQIKLTLEYDGANYCGWQSQINGIAIQDVLAKAVEQMVQHPVTIYGASRTDAGVHALGQVATFFTDTKIPPQGFLEGLNGLLPEDIRVQFAEEVPESFHPRNSAQWKQYRYLILNQETPSALERHRVWHIREKLDVIAMQQAAEILIGEHDFAAFQGSGGEVANTVRNLKWIRMGHPERSEGSPGDSSATPQNDIHIDFLANGFLRHMVRNIVGTLVEIGEGKRSADSIKEILASKDRRNAGITAPAQGLYLVKIDYPF